MKIDELRYKYLSIVKIFIIIIYAVGVIGILLPQYSELMASLTPVTLIISFFLILVYQEEKIGKRFITIALILYFAGLILEMIGVNSGKIFGVYTYGENLGPKIYNTPWIIGINWVMLSYLTATISIKWFNNRWLKIIFGASLMLLYDFFLEQSAPVMDLWTWEGNAVPLLNYFSWAIAALVFQAVWHLSGIQLKNKIAAVLVSAMYLFFIILYIARII